MAVPKRMHEPARSLAGSKMAERVVPKAGEKAPIERVGGRDSFPVMAFAEIVDRSLHATAASALRFGSICMVVGANLQNRARSPGIWATHSDQSSEINTNDALGRRNHRQ